ncbi:polysialyltransferase family glycosyltransferase [Streptomyces sp. NRRL S-118]|uniref:polysialyltransferase family glycosyltransferase n=1 Tax=Streptomyces sp. NRRL S-118 TaxID=1463881 RepID=UPI0004CBB692|nr:polysialyltransferase family glycosyltransferase [Streptomyces sp. NRRL S-118]
MSTQIFYASTLYGAVTLAAAIDSGCFEPADRRLLLVANNAATPETAVPLDRMPGFDRLSHRFDAVLSWNDAVAPFHPGGWTPRPDDVPLWERYLRLLWGLGDDRVALAVESLQVPPALTVAQLFPEAAIDVYADGLMSYGPTRNRIDPLVGERVRRLLHLDLVPGLRPLLLAEFGVVPEVVPAEAFTKVVDELAEDETGATGGGDAGYGPDECGPDECGPDECGETGEGVALLLGQYLSALGILSPAEEEDLHVRMVRGAVARGHRRIVFKPHPVAPASWSRTLELRARELGAELTVPDRPVLAEVLFRRLRPALVAGCFSTALFTASGFYGLPVARLGTAPLLDRLTPYQNSNRVPVTLADALLPDLESGGTGGVPDLAGLLDAVGFAMQPQVRADLRPAAERYLADRLTPATRRYFKRRRLTALGLPGGLPGGLKVPRTALTRLLVRRARRLKRAALRR